MTLSRMSSYHPTAFFDCGAVGEVSRGLPTEKTKPHAIIQREIRQGQTARLRQLQASFLPIALEEQA